MKPSKIRKEELLFSGEMEDDRTNTYLSLDDYDWMCYTLKTRFKTERYGILYVKFEYFGLITSRMEIKQYQNEIVKKYVYEYPTNLFQSHIVSYLNTHIESWSGTYAFNGEDLVLGFYNEVIEIGNLLEVSEIEKEKSKAMNTYDMLQTLCTSNEPFGEIFFISGDEDEPIICFLRPQAGSIEFRLCDQCNNEISDNPILYPTDKWRRISKDEALVYLNGNLELL